MDVCSRCGNTLNPGERFCGSCGLDTQAATQATAVQQTAPQAVYMPPTAQDSARTSLSGNPTAQAAMGLGIGGGLLGILWGALGPYLSLKAPSHIGWFNLGPGYNPYLTGIEPVILLVVGIALGILAVLGAFVATRAILVTRVLLLVCGLVGFLLGPSWLVPGALLLVGGGLAIAARPQEK